MISRFATDVPSEMLGSILWASEHLGICGGAHELGVLQPRAILTIGDRRSALMEVIRLRPSPMGIIGQGYVAPAPATP